MPRKRGSALYENSPALQCWVYRSNKARVPAGTKEWSNSSRVEAESLSSLTGLGAPPDAYPALNCWAIFGTETPCAHVIFTPEKICGNPR